MDKIVIQFFSDVLYLKGIICLDEYEDILDCCIPSDLDKVFEKMMKDEYNAYRRGDIDYDRFFG